MKEFFDRVAVLKTTSRPDIVEKDYELHRMLSRISQDEYLRENLIFKGGTCLIKAYLGYYRFSEDLDFAWRDQGIWDGRSKSATSKRCSEEITHLIERFKGISDALGLEFKGDKTDDSQVHISSGGRMVLFYIGYRSDVTGIASRFKVEVNFVDKLLFAPAPRELSSLIDGIESEDMKFLYPDLWNAYCGKISLQCYDTKEIFVEKCRASLTRHVYKLRDILDIYFLGERYGLTIKGLSPQIKEKILFILDLYKRYRDNIEFTQFPTIAQLNKEEEKLLLIERPEGLYHEIERIHKQLEKIRDDVQTQ